MIGWMSTSFLGADVATGSFYRPGLATGTSSSRKMSITDYQLETVIDILVRYG